MTSFTVAELSERAREIFRLVVESYLGSGQPVGSHTLAAHSALGLSSASIRNVMRDLEEAGLLASPHVSGGRMPTQVGLRLFVDGIMQMTQPSEEEQRAIRSQVRETGPIEEALAAASAALSGLSACAGMILVPKKEAVIRQFSFVGLEEGRGLAVLVGEDGQVENRIMDLPSNLSLSALAEAGNYINARLSGLTLQQAQMRLELELRDQKVELDNAARSLVERGLASWTQDGAQRPVLIVRGQANLLDSAADDLERVRLLLEELEEKQEIARLMESALSGRATKIFIGSENKLFSLSGSSLIAAPYHNGEGNVVGVVGVIGPTRLNYARVVPMVDFTAQTLSRLMR